MPSIIKCFAFFSLALFASALTTPHGIRNVNHHRAVAAALVTTVPESVVVQQGAISARSVRRRRSSNSARCKPKSSSTSPAASTPPANVEGAPPSVTSHSSSPKSTPKSTPKATPKATHTPTSSSGGSGGGIISSILQGMQTGQGTYYGTGLGACGITNNDNQHIVAVSHTLFDNYPGYNGANPNQNPICGKKVTATYQGKSVQVTITDRCVGCAPADLDFAPAAFSVIADQAIGRIFGMTWVWD